MKIFFLLISAVFLFANGIESKIINVNKNKILLDKNIKKGISGVVLCPYENNEIICARAVSIGDNKAILYPYAQLKNDAFALPVVIPKKNDKVLFAKDYSRIMIIALNQTSYLKTKEKYLKNVIIPIDVFGAFLNKKPSKKDFVKFAKKMDIGRFIFVLDKIYEVDAFSLETINAYKNPYKKRAYKLPFFTSYKFYDIKIKNPINYYKSLIKE